MPCRTGDLVQRVRRQDSYLREESRHRPHGSPRHPWRSGADECSTPERKAFANDLDNPQLIAVTDSVNQSNGDQTPDLWKPSLKSSWCTHSRAWVDVKHIYHLNVTEAEKNALRECSTPAHEHPKARPVHQ